MVTLENHRLKVEINPLGAELTSVIDRATGHEFIWQADEKYWNRHAPVLFPIVGTLRDNQYKVGEQSFELSRHGFARDAMFTTQTVTSNSATFNLKSDEESLKVYPYEFSFQINYILHDNTVTVSYEILNPSSSKVLYYSVGGHPAFNVSVTKKGNNIFDFDQVSYQFSPSGQYLRIPLTNEGLIDYYSAKYEIVDEIPLKHKSFRKDAIIYQINGQTEVKLIDKAAKSQVLIQMNEMTYFGIWSPYNKRAPFVCLEPWAGIADDGYTNEDFSEKRGINSLEAHQIKTHDFSMAFSIEE